MKTKTLLCYINRTDATKNGAVKNVFGMDESKISKGVFYNNVQPLEELWTLTQLYPYYHLKEIIGIFLIDHENDVCLVYKYKNRIPFDLICKEIFSIINEVEEKKVPDMIPISQYLRLEDIRNKTERKLSIISN
ncbi:MAG: hypothetical protein PHU61_01640 [Candidatus Absconditabacteria bacterium]|nr:hypothetical protein [Candidatus Absconditabacteria bacterium]MDD3867997.1 hypothetical protein [Candidatus Absconditabacteria bacterium]MDD4714244.1 hypothetical protein [Candidatus Absconditabacteria bacterium]